MKYRVRVVEEVTYEIEVEAADEEFGRESCVPALGRVRRPNDRF